jgi:hypothetical protein
MSVTYYVALPFVRTEDGVAPGEAQEMPNERAAIRQAESMSRDSANAGALAFKRSGDPNMGNFGDATILKSFGEVPKNLDELWRLDSSAAAPLASHDFVALLQSAFSLAIFARFLLVFGASSHDSLTINHGSIQWEPNGSQNKKAVHLSAWFVGSGGRIWTADTRIMIPLL